jgi:hypothetical protein
MIGAAVERTVPDRDALRATRAEIMWHLGPDVASAPSSRRRAP